MLHLVHGAPPTLRDRLAPWVPPATHDLDLAALDELIARCLNPDPAARPTATDLLQGFHELDPFDPGDRVTALPVRVRRTDEPLIRFDDATTVHPTSQPAEPEARDARRAPQDRGRRRVASWRSPGAAVAAVVFLVGRRDGCPSARTAQLSRSRDGAAPGDVVDARRCGVDRRRRSATVCCRSRHATRWRWSAAINRTTCSGSRPERSADDRSVVDQRCSEAFEGFVGRRIETTARSTSPKHARQPRAGSRATATSSATSGSRPTHHRRRPRHRLVKTRSSGVLSRPCGRLSSERTMNELRAVEWSRPASIR